MSQSAYEIALERFESMFPSVISPKETEDMCECGRHSEAYCEDHCLE